MKFNCSHVFTLEAKDREDFDAKLARYQGLVRKASERLDIGYDHVLMCGNVAAVFPAAIDQPKEKELETLFDG